MPETNGITLDEIASNLSAEELLQLATRLTKEQKAQLARDAGYTVSEPNPNPQPEPNPTPTPTPTPTPEMEWRKIADRNVNFTLSEPAKVRWGVGDRWIERDLAQGEHNVEGNTNRFFGGDPAPGVIKTVEALLKKAVAA
jgi:hypothetical protein